jgi:flagellar basal body-associated protein FliL
MRLSAALLSARDLIVTLGIRLVPIFIMAALTLVSFWFLQKNTQPKSRKKTKQLQIVKYFVIMYFF